MIPRSLELSLEDQNIFMLPKDIAGLKLENYTFKKMKNGNEYLLFNSKSPFYNEPGGIYAFILIDKDGKESKFTSQYSVFSNLERAEGLMKGHKILKFADYVLEAKANEFKADDIYIVSIPNEMLQMHFRKSNICYSFIIEGASIRPDQIKANLINKINYLAMNKNTKQGS
jgi:hypothetical protein